jgi:outer membrane protein, adhesin transport system
MRYLSWVFFVYFYSSSLVAGQVSHESLSSNTTIGLLEILDEVLMSNPGVESQRRMTASAKSDVKSAKLQFLPTPSVSVQQVSAPITDPSYGTGSSRVTTLYLQQPIWTGGKLTANLSKAESQKLLADAALQDGRRQMAFNAVQAYADYISAKRKTAIYDDNINTQKGLLSLVERRILSGASPRIDYEFANGRLESTLSEADAIGLQLQMSKFKLKELIGRDILVGDSGYDRVLNLIDISQVSKPDLIDSAIATNPQVVKAKALEAIAKSDIDIKKAAAYPDVYVRAERQNGNFQIANEPAFNRIFVGISTQFGAGFSNFSQESSAKEKYNASKFDVESTIRAARERLSSDIESLATYKARLVKQVNSAQAALSTYQSWHRQFLAGKKTWQDLNNAAKELTYSQAAVHDLKSAILVLNWRISVEIYGLDESLDILALK